MEYTEKGRVRRADEKQFFGSFYVKHEELADALGLDMQEVSYADIRAAAAKEPSLEPKLKRVQRMRSGIQQIFEHDIEKLAQLYGDSEIDGADVRQTIAEIALEEADTYCPLKGQFQGALWMAVSSELNRRAYRGTPNVSLDALSQRAREDVLERWYGTQATAEEELGNEEVSAYIVDTVQRKVRGLTARRQAIVGGSFGVGEERKNDHTLATELRSTPGSIKTQRSTFMAELRTKPGFQELRKLL